MSTEVLTRSTALVRRALNGPTMGSRWSSVYFAPESVDREALRSALQSSVDRVDQQMSTWKPDSDLNRLSEAPLGAWVDVPGELTVVLEAALDIGRASDGLFDIGVGDLVTAWGFGGGAREPDARAIVATSSQAAYVAPKNLVLDARGQRARKLAPLCLDLSGIAKGFGVDELARVMREFKIASFLVGIDGEMRACGTKPGGRAWTIGHERPVRGVRDLAGILELQDTAVATSGNYRHHATVDGREVSHTMDPRMRQPLSNDLAAVTVIASTCMFADAWATALLVAGPERGPSIARAQNMSVIFINRDGVVISTL